MELDQKAYEPAITFRGTVIHWSIIIETTISEILSYHFCGNDKKKRDEFLFLVLSKESYGLNAKIESMNYLIDNHYSEILKEYPQIKESLTFLLDTRNHCAHRDVMSHESTDNPVFSFKHYKVKGNKITGIPKVVEVNTGTLLQLIGTIAVLYHGLNLILDRIVENYK